MNTFVPVSMLTKSEQQNYSLRSVVCQLCGMSQYRNRVVIYEAGIPNYDRPSNQINIPRAYLAKASSFCEVLYSILIQIKTGAAPCTEVYEKAMQQLVGQLTVKLVNDVAL